MDDIANSPVSLVKECPLAIPKSTPKELKEYAIRYCVVFALCLVLSLAFVIYYHRKATTPIE